MLGAWALEIVPVLVAIQLLAVGYFQYRHRTRSARSDSTESTTTDENPLIEYGSCGTENEPDYRYCRQCTSELTGESIPGYRCHSPSERSL